MTTAAGQWPSGLSERAAGTNDANDPHDASPAPDGPTVGAAHGGGSWYLTQSDRLRRIPLGAQSEPGPAAGVDAGTGAGDHDEVKLPEVGVDRLGDCDVAGDRVYVAMEGTVPARIGVFDLDLDFRGSAPVIAQSGSCTWCAVDPRHGLLYSSPLDTAHLCVYQMIGGAGSLGLRHRRDVALWADDGTRLRLDRVRGGTFADDGHLYLTTDGRDGAIHGIEVRSGRRVLHHPLDPLGALGPEATRRAPDQDMVGGITATKQALHVLVRDPVTDEVRFRHFGLDS